MEHMVNVYANGVFRGKSDLKGVIIMRQEFREIAEAIMRASKDAHIVYYGDFRDDKDRIVSANFHMVMCDDKQFKALSSVFCGFIGAVHRHWNNAGWRSFYMLVNVHHGHIVFNSPK